MSTGTDDFAAESEAVAASFPALYGPERIYLGRLPLLSAFTCIIKRFEVPGFTPFGAALADAPNGGAVAVFAPTGLNQHAEGRALGELFYRELGRQQPGERLGD